MLRNVHDIVNYHKKMIFSLFEPLKDPRIEMPNTPNSDPTSTKKRKLPAEPNNASPNYFPLEFKSTKRSGDNVEAMNNELYTRYCEFIRSDVLSTQDMIYKIQANIRRRQRCRSHRYYSNFDIQRVGVEAIKNLVSFCAQEPVQPIKLDIQALKLFASEIPRRVQHCANVVDFSITTLKGTIFIRS